MKQLSQELITSGCSYTQYPGFTYADYLGFEYDNHHNLGLGGAGNNAIYNNFINLAQHTEFTNSKVDVIIQWSSILRVDQYINNSIEFKNDYALGGIIFQNLNYSEGYVSKHFNINYQILMFYNYIFAIEEICANRKWNLKMTYMLEPWIENLYGEPGFKPSNHQHILNIKKQLTPKSKEILKALKTHYPSPYFPCESIEMFCLSNPKPNPTYYQDDIDIPSLDTHPSSHQHFLYAQKFALFLGKQVHPYSQFMSKEITKIQETKHGFSTLKNSDKNELLTRYNHPRKSKPSLI